MEKFVISSGHGKYVSGAGSYIDEVTEARRVVAKVADYLNQLNCSVSEFHDNTSKNQRDNINTIVRYHNSKQRDLDISVHFNAASKTNDPRGVEVLYVNDKYKDLAEKVSLAIANSSGLKNRGAKKRTNLGFLNGTSKPAILIEVAFVDSKADVDIYNDKFNDVCKAIAETVSGKKALTTPKPTTVKSNSTPPTSKQSSNRVKIKTGGLNPEMLKEVSEYLIKQGWYAEAEFSKESNPTVITGNLTPSMKKEFAKWLDDRGWWYKVI